MNQLNKSDSNYQEKSLEFLSATYSEGFMYLLTKA